VLTSRTDLPAAEVCWRLAARWRQENYFKYARAHFALDALDSYADTPDDPTRPVPNPAKAAAKTAVETARASVHDAETALSEAIEDAAGRARRPGSGATATVDPAAGTALAAARDRLTAATDTSRATPSHLPLHQVRPDARLLDEERKLLTHAIGDGCLQRRVHPESTLARMLRPHYSRATAGPTTKPAPCSGSRSPSPATCTSPGTGVPYRFRTPDPLGSEPEWRIVNAGATQEVHP
jgi:hypothetical protein